MKAKKYKHLSFEDRCVIEEFLNNNYNFTKIGNRIGKDRTTISHEIKKHRFLYYFMRALNIHFLVLLSIKLFADSILELDKIWDITLFNSIKDVQTLIGYVITLLIGRNMKVEPGIDEPAQLKEKIKKSL